jgi:hypothetical protein
MLEVALDALSKNIAPIPVIEGTKVPAVKWKEWQTKLPPEELVREWFSVRRNIAIVTSGMVLFDCDDPALAERVLSECGDTPHKVQTPRGGVHLGFRARKGVALGNQVKVKGLELDIRTAGGIEVIPSSWTEVGDYAWLGSGLRQISELPLAKISWTRERVKRVVRKPQIVNRDLHIGNSIVNSRVRDPFAYCLRIPSIQGQNGSKALVRVVCTLRESGVPAVSALDYLWNVWNPRCAEPAWSEAELRYAVRRHYGEEV